MLYERRRAVGRKLICRTSAGLTPRTVNPTDSAKNAIPNDMANLGCRMVPHTGSASPEAHACTRSSHETRGWVVSAGAPRRPLAIPVVDARTLSTNPAGGSTAVRDFSPLRPGSASTNSAPQLEHTLECSRKLSSLAPVSRPSIMSASKASNSLQIIPLLVFSSLGSGITSPAYRYVVVGEQVPLGLDLFWISRYPPEPSKRLQFRGSPYLVSPLESLLPEAPATACPELRARSHQPPGCARARREPRIGPEFAH